MKIKNILFIVVMFSFSTIFSQETIKKYADNTLSEVTYSMSNPLHDWKGVNKNVRAVIKKDKNNGKIIKVAIALKVADFNSENANRDSHALDILDAIKYPIITFVSSEISENSITGILTFHNVKKKISFPILIKTKKGKEIYSGSFDVDMTEFDIKRPTLMNMPTDKIIKINFLLFFN